MRTTPRALRILTNSNFYAVSGIAQYVLNFVEHNEVHRDFIIHAVGISQPQETGVGFVTQNFKNFRLIKRIVNYPPLGDVNQLAQGDLAVFRKMYSGIIAAYAREIKRVKPDIILINGSYFMPWCLFEAAREYGKASIYMHYHGILSKEIAHWTNARDRSLMNKMERSFDSPDVFYIFPSALARRVVEREVFKHKIKKCAVLPNPIAPEFFMAPSVRRKGGVGVVGRWTKIKNIDFVARLAKHNAKSKTPIPFTIVSNPKHLKDDKSLLRIVRLNGPMANRKLAKFYNQQGVIISPSLFETYGNVAQEAIAAGTPAFVSSQMGVSETFNKIGLSYWVIDFTSPATVLKKVKKTMSAQVPQEAINALRDNYSRHNIFTQYSLLLRSKKYKIL